MPAWLRSRRFARASTRCRRAAHGALLPALQSRCSARSRCVSRLRGVAFLRDAAGGSVCQPGPRGADSGDRRQQRAAALAGSKSEPATGPAGGRPYARLTDRLPMPTGVSAELGSAAPRAEVGGACRRASVGTRQRLIAGAPHRSRSRSDWDDQQGGALPSERAARNSEARARAEQHRWLLSSALVRRASVTPECSLHAGSALSPPAVGGGQTSASARPRPKRALLPGLPWRRHCSTLRRCRQSPLFRARPVARLVVVGLCESPKATSLSRGGRRTDSAAS